MDYGENEERFIHLQLLAWTQSILMSNETSLSRLWECKRKESILAYMKVLKLSKPVSC